MESGVTQHTALAVIGHDKAGLRVIQFLLQGALTPGLGEALLLQLGDLLEVTAIHGYNHIFHIKRYSFIYHSYRFII